MRDRLALVTGGGGGLGTAIGAALTRAGAEVVLADVDVDAAMRAAEVVRGRVAHRRSGGPADDAGVTAIGLDITDPAAVDDAVARLVAARGRRFDCLVNNAGTDRGADLVDVDDGQWHRVFGVNVDGPMFTSRAFVRHLLTARDGDRSLADIVMIGSISALTVGAGAGAYNASKAALAKLTEVLQTEARERAWPVRVSLIHPAAMDTPMMEQWHLPDDRMMDPAVVADLVVTAISLPHDVQLQSLVVTKRVEYFPR